MYKCCVTFSTNLIQREQWDKKENSNINKQTKNSFKSLNQQSDSRIFFKQQTIINITIKAKGDINFVENLHFE
jgi:hypothetical protein